MSYQGQWPLATIVDLAVRIEVLNMQRKMMLRNEASLDFKSLSEPTVKNVRVILFTV